MSFLGKLFSGTKKAKAVKEAAGQNREVVERMYQDTVQRNQPFTQSGYAAQGQINGLLGLGGTASTGQYNGVFDVDRATANQNFQDSAFHTLPFDEGMSAIEGSAAARGGLLSGSTAKGVIDYSQNKANNNFMNYFNSLSGTAGSGQVANQSLTNAGQNYQNGQIGANNQVAQAAGIRADAWGNAIGDALGTATSFFGGGF
ncbi:MAG: hypothetical protein COB36_14830 [Alphaproteobacteria bacterium]|nr:MAG: hypothetical protein COB36_14830 [Alphaproteobacteria bacterium]